MKDRDRKALRAALLHVDKELQLGIGGAAITAIGRLSPHRAAIPGTTMDEALDQIRTILTLSVELQTDLRQARRLLKKRKS